MSLLLDTHSLLWFLLDDPRLSEKAKMGIMKMKSEVFVSPASLWEIAIKISIGKYSLPEPFDVFWKEQLNHNHFSLLPISVDHAGMVTKLPYHHRDPFDRLIIAQALVEKIPLISCDKIFDSYTVERIW